MMLHQNIKMPYCSKYYKEDSKGIGANIMKDSSVEGEDGKLFFLSKISQRKEF